MSDPQTQIGARPRLRYLRATDVATCLPPMPRRLELAAAALSALASGDAEMPPKISIHPREGCHLEAMPCWHRVADVVGVKWVAEYGTNRRRGLPGVHALIVLNDRETGIPTWILDGTRITAVRTAAVSGVAVRALAPPAVRRAAILGAGVQGRSHLTMLGYVLPGISVSVYDPSPEAAERFARSAEEEEGIGSVDVTATAEAAVVDAQIVVTAAALGSVHQVMQPGWVPRDCLIVSLDDDTYVSGALARSAKRFVVDDRPQFLAYRAGGAFDGYPEPVESLGEFVNRQEEPQVDEGRRLVTSIGTAVVDVLFAEEVRQRAEGLGLGLELEAWISGAEGTHAPR